MLVFGALRHLRRRSEVAARGEVAACEGARAAEFDGDEEVIVGR